MWFPLVKKQRYFSEKEKKIIVDAIQIAEKETSGEIRVYIEGKNPMVDPLDRAKEIFFKLKMQHTENRNAVLLYVALLHRELALFGDEGIHKQVGDTYWNDAVKLIIADFNEKNIPEAIANCVIKVGKTLHEKFPYLGDTDKNELPDEIIFGK